MSRMCSVKESGTPAGAPASSRGSPLVLRASMRSMRRSTSRMFSRYCSMRCRSLVPSAPCMCATSPASQSRMLRLVRLRAVRSAAVPPAPKSMSNAWRGSRIMGSGSDGDAQLIMSV
jgi:hypothetical protein